MPKGHYCPFVQCAKKTFRSDDGVRAHLNSVHRGVPLPLDIETAEHQEPSQASLAYVGPTIESTSTVIDDLNDVFMDDGSVDMAVDTEDQYEPDSASAHGDSGDSDTEVAQPIHEAQVGGTILAYKGGTTRKFGTMNIVEQQLAEFSLEHNMSSSQYSDLVVLVQQSMDYARASPERVVISTKTAEELNRRLHKDADEVLQVPLETSIIDLRDVEDLPAECNRAELSAALGTIRLCKRNIKQLAQLIFSDPFLSKSMILRPVIQTRGSERVFSDIHTGKWWENLQMQIPPSHVVLGIMLSSDQTDVSQNGRFKLWPVYLKLANVPQHLRDKPEFRASRVLAYLPVIANPVDGVSRPWWSAAKTAIIHHCLHKILEPLNSDRTDEGSLLLRGPNDYIYHCVPALAAYSADLPEQRLLTCVKSGASALSCPRCFVPTKRFNELVGFEEVTVRANFDMKDLYRQATSINRVVAFREFCKTHSIFSVKNAFWSVEHFDIYESLLVDDLHQLGGTYFYLLRCVEKIIKKDGHTKEVTGRAADIPDYAGLRKFTTGYLPSGLKNPTYSELRAHMKILLACIHDLIPLQASLCLRHFIDFYYLATADEHSNASLQEMDFALKMYNKYSPIFQKYSPCKMKFPKNHSLSKYIHDIESHGVVKMYTTNHSELQHKRDAKKPAKRTNFQKADFTSQVSKFIIRRDLFYDQYPKQTLQQRTSEPSVLSSPRKYELMLPRYDGSNILFDDFARDNHDTSADLYEMVRHFLNTVADGAKASIDVSRMPEPDTRSARFYQAFLLNEYGDEGALDRHIIYSTAAFRSDVKKYYVSLKKKYYAQVLFIFTVTYRDIRYDLFCGQRFEPADEPHASGLEIAYTTENHDYQGRFVARIADVIQCVHLVPDFSSRAYAALSPFPYERYLVNHDVSQGHWWEGRKKGTLLEISDANLVKWNDDCGDPTLVGMDEEGLAEATEAESSVVVNEDDENEHRIEDVPWYFT